MTVDELFERARSQVGLKIRYKLGAGSFVASRHTCADSSGPCDCSSFVCWALGVDKRGDYPYLVPPGSEREPGGEWYGTDNIYNDALHINVGLFQQIDQPKPGCVVVFPTTWKNGKASPPGHVGIVTALDAKGSVAKVIHCSSSNFKNFGHAVQETDDAAFRGRSVYAWCARIEPTEKTTGAGDVASLLALPVRFCVVATGTDQAAIVAAAKPLADLNPLGRRVVVPGDPDYPDAENIANWTKGVAQPGAVILRPSGDLFTVYTVAQAKSPARIEQAFIDAR
jgi:hypothetical protein